MSNTISAFAIKEHGGKFEKYDFDAGDLPGDQVELRVISCGICHSDLSMAENSWGMTTYPFVGGHEVYGEIIRVGSAVTTLKVGQKAGIGWAAGYCNQCRLCDSGDQHLCPKVTGTIVQHHGGFSDKVRAQAKATFAIPEGIEGDHLGPLFCGGITVFSPILDFVKPEHKVGVVGIGGLGSMAIQFLRKWGCQVTAFTSSTAKRASALELGAHDAISSTDREELKANAGRFDVIISTVNVKLDWNALLGTLAPRGRLHIVGAVLEPLDIGVFGLMLGAKTVSSSPTGPPEQIKKMLDFVNRHQIKPEVAVFPFTQINEAFEELKKSKQGRIVLKW